ncbi:PH domain-containing protein [Curtobacterium sp. RRHDQ10]|uniref:PH domain-containing protein n=1 Tax=Curtobacterium phyllosphaerae TaxID=3413379 RepID=UPI003BF1D390
MTSTGRGDDRSLAASLTDGEWHRLHPATPLLKGGFVLVAIFFFVFNQFRERLVDAVIPGDDGPGPGDGDPIDYVVSHNYVGMVLLGVLVFVAVLIGLFTLAWRMHTFRVTGEVVEVRSGVLFRNHRKARLDRIQGVNIGRPFLARILGAARLEISQAGNDANVQLAYLGSRAADDLRQRILQLASGAREDDGPRAVDPTTGRFVEQRMNEFLSPELDPVAMRATSVVKVHQGRLIGSLVLSETTVFIVLAAVAIVVSVAITGRYFLLVTFAPAIIGAVGFYVRKFTKSLQYTIAATRDGIRIGFGLVSTSNETLPPGRIHAVSVTQPLLWRPFGWWDVRINRASHSQGGRQAQQVSSVVLPVGTAADVRAVLEIILPELVGTAVAGPAASFEALRQGSAAAVGVVEESLTTTGDAGGFVRSPGRGAWFRPLSWRRNGHRQVPGAVLFRLGAIWRSLVVVPLPRVQSVRVAQGPLDRVLRLASVHVHTVHGPVIARIGALDAADAMRLFTETEANAVAAADADTSHRWRERAQPAVADGREARPTSATDGTRVAPPVRYPAGAVGDDLAAGWRGTPRPEGDHP